MRLFNPLRRVPTVVLDDGESLIDSSAILDWLDENAGHGQRLIAQHGAERRAALKICALATGLADKAVSLLYERVLHKETSQVWIDRCHAQIADVLDALEADRAARAFRVVVRRAYRPCRYRGRLRHPFHPGGP